MELKQHYLPKLASGAYLGAFALTEPGAGSDAANLKTSAKKDGDNYILNGSKMFITNGMDADTYITFARTSDEQGAKGISAFIVEKNSPGLVIGKKEKKMGLHGSSTVQLNFDQCFVPRTQLLGIEGEGCKLAMPNFQVGRTDIAVRAHGIGDGELKHAKTYATACLQSG